MFLTSSLNYLIRQFRSARAAGIFFIALFFLLDGKPKQTGESDIVLRRILYNIIAYPFMKLFEHDSC